MLGGVSAETLQRYRNVRQNHVEFCAKRGIQTWNDVDTKAVEQFCNWLTSEKLHKPRTVHMEVRTVMSVLRCLIDQKVLPESCAVRLSLRKPQGTDTYCYSVKQVVAMIDHCRAKPGLDWLGDVILALACTGLRISELCVLRWSDINLESNMIRIVDERSSSRKDVLNIRRTKGRRSRALPIHTDLRKVLEKLPRTDDGRVFHSATGCVLRRGNVLENLKEKVIDLLKDQFPTPEGEIGFKDGTLRGLRHYFCSKCFVDGASEGEIRDWLGHAESKMVEHYRHLSSEDSQRKMRNVNFLGHPSDTSPTNESRQ